MFQEQKADMHRPIMNLVCGAALVLLPALHACTPTDMLNPQLLSSMTGAGRAASLPGDAPALLVGVENRTDRVIRVMVMYRAADDSIQTYTTGVQPGGSTAQALICPIPEITVGDLSDATAIGAQVVLGNGTVDDPFINVEPFGITLKSGVNYDCGDGLTFVVQPSGATVSGYQIFAYIRRSDGGG